MGLSPEYFWSLTWYDWGLYVWKLHKARQQQLTDREFAIERTRQVIAMIYNTNRGASPVKDAQDFWPLSYDKKAVVNERPLDFKEVKALLGSKIKKADGGQ